jgi:enoyl-CoA hydratase/carnithine racemase
VFTLEIRGSVGVITVDNGRLNILTREMHAQLYHILLTLLRDDKLKVGVLTCRPNTSFSAGDDLKTVDDPYGDAPDWEELVMTLPRDKPIVGAVRGHCVGQGLIYLLLLTDIRFCTPDASFGFPEIARGMGGGGIVSRLCRHIPPAIAMHMILTGEALGAEKARACSLVNDIVTDDGLLDRTLQVAAKVATHPMAALRTEMWPAAREIGVGQADLVARVSALWGLQRRLYREAGPGTDSDAPRDTQ